MLRSSLFALLLSGFLSPLPATAGTARCLFISKVKKNNTFADQICFSQIQGEISWTITLTNDRAGRRREPVLYELEELKRDDGPEGFEYREYGVREIDDSILSDVKVTVTLYDQQEQGKTGKVGEVKVGLKKYYASTEKELSQ